MNLVYHCLRIGKLIIKKFHSIPQIVTSPILPVLNNTINRYSKFAIFLYNTNGFILTFITLLTLPVSISPQRKHGNLPCKITHLSNNTISIASIHEIVVYTFSHFRTKRCFARFVFKVGWRIVIPEKTITFHRLKKCNKIPCIILNHVYFLVSLRHFTILKNAKTIDGFVLIKNIR